MIPGMGGGNPRQLAMMMKKLGIDVEEIEGVEEVVVRTKTHEYRFAKASVSIMRAHGTETWQIVGKPSKKERAAAGAQDTPPARAQGSTPASGSAGGLKNPMGEAGPTPPLEVSDDDVKFVMKETGKDAATCRKALEASGGDLAEAIVRLSS
jgi:nascent polypeptide-associated complex subunit alpha